MADRTCPVCQNRIDDGTLTCPNCHFKLSGATQRFRPVLNDLAVSNDRPEDMKCMLTMARGPQIGTVFPLEDDVVTIGRNPKCDIFLDDMTVSRNHAEITRHGNAFVLMDLHSFNGVWVNNATVTEHVLKPDDYVQIGKYDFIYSESDSSDTEVEI